MLESIKLGAKDFVVKPFQAERVLEAVGKAPRLAGLTGSDTSESDLVARQGSAGRVASGVRRLLLRRAVPSGPDAGTNSRIRVARAGRMGRASLRLPAASVEEGCRPGSAGPMGVGDGDNVLLIVDAPDEAAVHSTSPEADRGDEQLKTLCTSLFEDSSHPYLSALSVKNETPW